MITLQSHGARGAPLQQVVFALVACQLRCRFEWGARFRVAAESNGRPDESCPDPADILVGIAVLETPLLIKSLMSQTQGERIGNDQQSVGS